MFEQGEFKAPEASEADAKNTALRGARYKDSFIPPRPFVAEEDTYAATQSRTAFHQTMQQHQHQPLVQRQSQASTQPLQLNPPRVPNPQQQQQNKKRSPSLFERITGAAGAAMHHLDSFREEEVEETQQRAERVAPSPITPTGLTAPPRPMQGSLAIDAPARPKAVEEGELDIPAFLRRQAN